MAPEGKLTEYERRRLENIRRNDEVMAALKLHTRAAELSAASKRQKLETKTYKANNEKKQKTENPVVIRRSLRARGLPPDLKGLSHDESDESNNSVAESPKHDPRASARHDGPISMDDAYCGSGSDRAFREIMTSLLKSTETSSSAPRKIDKSRGQKAENMCDSDVGSRHDIKCEDDDEALVDLNCLTLDEKNIARVVPGRILSVKFFPTANMRMITVGNKFGNVGFWNMESREDEDEIFLYQPHPAPVSGISIPESNPSKMFTCCYDGFLRKMDVEKEIFNLVYSTDEAIFSLCQQPNSPSCLYFGEGRGGLKFFDERTGKSSALFSLHEDRINTIDFSPKNPSIMATSSSDGTARIWDLRNVGSRRPKNVGVVNHKKAVHSAYFSPSGATLATSSFDNSIRIVSGSDFEETSVVYHNNQTGRWISSFKAIWGWDDSYIFTGNMKRAVDVISRTRRSLILSLESEYVSAIPCRFAAHPFEVGTLAGATSGGQVYTWTSL